MTNDQNEKPNILFLFSDTGGGHRSSAEAVIEAINLEYPNQICTEMVDIFGEYAPYPFDLALHTYSTQMAFPSIYGLGYRISNGRRRTRLFYNMVWPYVRPAIQRLLEEHPCDLIVSVHSLLHAPVLRAVNGKVPFIIVVTDLVTTHAAWYQGRADMTILPTEAALPRGLKLGLPQEKMEYIGLPIADRFCSYSCDKQEARRKLGWPTDVPIILMVGGGAGIGPLDKTAYAIDDARFPTFTVIVTGRNHRMKKRMEKHRWKTPVNICGFVSEMPDYMCAADILVTKAGPSSICEAFISGLPIILYSRIPGQEDGNVDFVVNEGAGVWTPEPEQVVETVRTWLEQPEERAKVAAACKRLARPRASRDIADLLASRVGIAPRKK